MGRDFLTLDDIDVHEKIVLLRGDLNVPVAVDGSVGDTTRLDRLAKTIRELVAKKAKTVVLSHFGRPKNGREEALSLRKVSLALSKIIAQPVGFCDALVGDKAKAAIAALKAGDVLVLENTRFEKGEEANDPLLAKQLAGMADVFVNDAFSVSHRAHVSTEGLAHFLPCCAGRDMQEELEALSRALDNPERPVMAMVGGSKISSKLDLLANLTSKVNKLALGGGMANTFLAASGKAMGNSLVEVDMLETAKRIMAESKAKGCSILLPIDVVVADKPTQDAKTGIVAVDAIPQEQMALDVGPQTVAAYCAALELCKTLVWNGPLGVFEMAPFAHGTKAVGRRIAELTQMGRLLSVAGGGDTVSAVNMAGVAAKLSYVSSAGGAFLEWLEGRSLPGVEILRRRANHVARVPA